MRWVFDVETDGFLPELTRIHCLVLRDPDLGARKVFRRNHLEDTVYEGLKLLSEADEVIGHNIVSFDLPAIFKVYSLDFPRDKVKDTFVLSRLYFQNIKEDDLSPRNKGKYPKNLFGQQSIEAWGYRLGVDKVGTDITDWSVWTQYMEDRCVSDVEVNVALLKHIEKQERWSRAEELEHSAQYLCSQIERNGIPFDTDGAVKLYGELIEVRERLANELKLLFPPWVVFQGEHTSLANNSKTGHTKGAVYSKILINEFNPQSRDHIADRLKSKYGWKPEEFTDGGKPKVDEKVLNALPYPEAKPLAELFLVMKRVGQIAEGPQAWLKKEKDGWIHYRLNPNGAVTGRATHSKVNITQVPKVGSRYGKECRELWGLIEPSLRKRGLWSRWKDGVLYGADVAGLELRALAHYMARYDDGAYGRAVVEGREEDGTDVHSLNTKALGLDPTKVYSINGKEQKGRNCGKTFAYAFLYGAGDFKLAKTLGQPPGKGKDIRRGFLQRLPALKALREAVEKASKRGYLRALDGRHMHVRSPHAALNTLLQGAGALVCKKWIVEIDRILRDDYQLKHGWDGDYAFLIWAHDEVQIACLDYGTAMKVEQAAEDAISIAEAYFGLKVPLDVGGKTGVTWKDTH